MGAVSLGGFLLVSANCVHTSQVTKEEHPHLDGLRVNLGSVGKTAVMETGALLEMMKAAMENMHVLVDERERLLQAKVNDLMRPKP